MSRFYGRIHGNKGPATRCGTAGSGLEASARGWNFGAHVVVYDRDGVDRARVVLDGGSNNHEGFRFELFDGTYEEAVQKKRHLDAFRERHRRTT